MSIYYLLLIWVLLGMLAALLALAARLKPASWSGRGWLWLLMLGLCSSLAGGMLGFWLLGRLFSSAVAAWIAILALCLPGFFSNLRTRRLSTQEPGDSV
jgi:uncharacterized membrane protein